MGYDLRRKDERASSNLVTDTKVATRVRAEATDDGRDNSYCFVEDSLSSVIGSSNFDGASGVLGGYVEAVMRAVVKNVAVATRDLGESLETPHRKWPLVHPDPSYLSAYSLMVIIY